MMGNIIETETVIQIKGIAYSAEYRILRIGYPASSYHNNYHD
ncbi:hypothetical protein [Bacteroides sp. MSB163]